MTPLAVSPILTGSVRMTETEEVIESLKHRKASIACNGKDGLLLALESLGFGHRAGKAEGHRVFYHDKWSEITGAYVPLTINCGHKLNQNMKPVYVQKVISFLEMNKDIFEKILNPKGEQHDKS
ncbi:hypothetical protein ACRZOU_003762 [Aeromonas salmonicida]|uniref:hypothetical protein n=1 Tax=Aeromonas salmonicida TaxID=645 RepID=UPI0028603261|nr:hypothetical protein [Aeromonas salmonicida]MDR6993458.1 hypothetical protein [Aeromonas salmonicida]